MARPRIFQQFPNSRSAGPRRSRLAHVSAVEESGTNVLAEGDESGAAASGESDASPTSLPPGVASGAAPAKDFASASIGEQSPQSLSASATGSPVASAQTSPEHTTAPAAAGDAVASASATASTAGVKAQSQPAVASRAPSLSGKPSRFVTTKATDDILNAPDTAKAPDDETSALAIASHASHIT